MRLLPLALLLAGAAAGADYPVSAGYMNDLTGAIPDAVQQALELRLRAYERATGNEVAVALVPSLQGESVEEYARGMYRAWGLGRSEKGGAVLFVWAPAQGQSYLAVGRGLEPVLTQAVCAGILGAAPLRSSSPGEGVQAVIDAVIQRLGGAPAPAAPREPGDRITTDLLIPGVVLLAVAIAMIFYHTGRTHLLQREVPAAENLAAQSLDDADARAAQAAADLATLRAEAPPELWQPLEAPLAAAPEQLQALRRDLAHIQGQRREVYGEWEAAHTALAAWKNRYNEQVAVIAAAPAALAQWQQARDESLALSATLDGELARLSPAEPGGESHPLWQAARETFDRAASVQAQSPVNWLLICDLLHDTQACLRYLAVLLDPAADEARKRAAAAEPPGVRLWPDSAAQSPAYLLLTAAPPTA